MIRYRAKTFVPKTYGEHGFEGISDVQIEEHIPLYAGYVKQVYVSLPQHRLAGDRAAPPGAERGPGHHLKGGYSWKGASQKVMTKDWHATDRLVPHYLTATG